MAPPRSAQGSSQSLNLVVPTPSGNSPATNNGATNSTSGTNSPNIPLIQVPHSNGSVKREPLSTVGNRKSTNSKPRKVITQPKTKPAFVAKLWTMVNDPTNQKYIQWMPDGKSFQVTHREQFEKMVLPKYFKHSNFSSFVRQLNMYGWHKVQDVNSGSMQNSDEMWQFKSPYFIRGREELLDQIVRNRGNKGSDDDDEPDLHQIMDELELIRSQHQNISKDLKRLTTENELLWQENYRAREIHQAHSQTLEKILRFLAQVYGSSNKILQNEGQGNTELQSTRNRLMFPNSDNERMSSPIFEIPSSSMPVASPSAIQELFTPSGSENSPKVSDTATQTGPFPDDSPIINSSSDFQAAPHNADSPARTTNTDLVRMNPAFRHPNKRFDSGSFKPKNLLLANQPNNTTHNPRDLFPELENSIFANQPPSNRLLTDTTHSLNALQKSLDSQGLSLDAIQDWLDKRDSSAFDQSQMPTDVPSVPEPLPLDHLNGTADKSLNTGISDPHIENIGSPNSNFDVGEFLLSPAATNDESAFGLNTGNTPIPGRSLSPFNSIEPHGDDGDHRDGTSNLTATSPPKPPAKRLRTDE